MRGSPRDARNYELMTVFSPDVPEDEIQGTIDRVVGYITTATGEVVDVNRDSPWGRRRLAYAIRHASRDVRDGFYTLYHFQVAPHRVEDIERELRLNDRVIRYLVTQYTPKPVDDTVQAAETTETGAAEAVESEPAGAEPESPAAEIEPVSAEVESLTPVIEPATAESESPAADLEPVSAQVESPAADVEPVTASDESESVTEDIEPAAEEPEAAAAPEPVEDVAEEAEATISGDDEADAEESAPPKEA